MSGGYFGMCVDAFTAENMGDMTQRALDQSLMSTGKEAVEWLQKNRVAVQEGGRGIKGWASRYRKQVKEAVRVWKCVYNYETNGTGGEHVKHARCRA